MSKRTLTGEVVIGAPHVQASSDPTKAAAIILGSPNHPAVEEVGEYALHNTKDSASI